MSSSVLPEGLIVIVDAVRPGSGSKSPLLVLNEPSWIVNVPEPTGFAALANPALASLCAEAVWSTRIE
jgi:hypothetical protein